MTTALILIIIILIFIMIIIGTVYSGIHKLKKAAGQMSGQLLDAEFAGECFDQIKAQYATTPKSLSAMTSLLLPQITKDFPDFSYDEMKEKAQNVLTSFLLAIHAEDTGKLTEGNSELKNKLTQTISILHNKEQHEYFDSIKLHRTEISNYTKKNGRCIITFQTSVQYYNYITDREGKVLSGSRDTLFQAKYETDLIYIQDRSLVESDSDSVIGLNCPNCGAPITSLGEKFCRYCGSGIIELNIHAWSFSDVRRMNDK